MARTLDLNSLDRPTLELTLRDDARTRLRLIYPSEKLVERFMAASDELTAVSKNKNADTIQSLYRLTADILNCNMDDVEVTAEELRDKYRVSFADLMVIYAAYLDFIKELTEAKN